MAATANFFDKIPPFPIETSAEVSLAIVAVEVMRASRAQGRDFFQIETLKSCQRDSYQRKYVPVPAAVLPRTHMACELLVTRAPGSLIPLAGDPETLAQGPLHGGTGLMYVGA